MTELTRAFVAVEISDEARQQIAGLLGRLKQESGTAVRWVRPELMHLTLAFLGEVTADFLETARSNLPDVIGRHSTFSMHLRGLGAFPSPSRARVVWAGVGQGESEVSVLQQDVVRTLCSVGYRRETRPFSPHLTIGRLRDCADVGRVVAVSFESERFLVGRVVLFRSVLQPAGPVYSVVAGFPLGVQPA